MIGKQTAPKSWRLPAEWEPQEAVQLTWPHPATDWAPMLSEITAVYRQMASEIARRERLIIVAPEGTAPDVDGAELLTCPTNDTWARDHAFLSLLDDDGHRRLLDYCFNGWGGKFEATLDNAINRHLYDSRLITGDYSDNLDFVLEGGSVESDGKGTVFTTSACLLAPHRNEPFSRSDIELRLINDFSAKRVLWIDHGLLTGDDTDGHIDTMVRVCPNDTLLYIGCDDTTDEHYEELQLMEAQLRNFRTLSGQPYRLRKLPMPHPIYDADGARLPATYANFLIINGAVLCPTYAQPDCDTEALSIIAQAFPDREIIGIDCRPVIYQHGSLHCCTMQYPKTIKHND